MVARSLAPFDPEVVRTWDLGSGPRGALLLHGFAGTPPELRRLGEHLAAHGWRCRAPVMAGHGTSPEDHERTTYRDWVESAQSALSDLMSTCEPVCVAGQSMGGAIALHLAAVEPRIRAVAAMATPLWVSDPRLRVIGVLKYLRRWHIPDGAIDLADPAAVEELYSYGRRSTRSLHELMRLLALLRRELPMIRQPVLLLHGARDRTVAPANLDQIARGLVCSAGVETVLLPRSGHAVSVDVEREEVNARVLAWFDRHVPAEVAAEPK